MLDFDALDFPLTVAHRGDSASFPENTIAAFEGAVAAGADVVEMDVRMTSDGVPVLMHDANVSVTTDGSGFVHELTLAELKTLDASGAAGSKIEVPTLREVLEALSGRCGLDIELKNIPGDPGFDPSRELAAEEVVKQLYEFDYRGLALVSSFNWLSIERVRDLAPDLPTGFLSIAEMDPRAALSYAVDKGHRFVLPQAGAVSEAGEDFVREAHDTGVLVGTWTIDDPAEIARMFDWGVDAVATNDPAAAGPVRDAARVARREG